MSPTLCNLCGWRVYHSDPDGNWLNQFRAVVSITAGDACLTGVGIYRDAEDVSFIAPSDPSARWDDLGYDQPESDEFTVRIRHENGRHGFIFHESCWSLLEKAFSPATVPIGRLYDVCLSLPHPLRSRCVSWGHDYGGLMLIDNRRRFPWEDREVELDLEELAELKREEAELKREEEELKRKEESNSEDDDTNKPPMHRRLGIPASVCRNDDDDDNDDNDEIELKVMPEVPKSDPLRVPDIQTLLKYESQCTPPPANTPQVRRVAGDRLFLLPEEIRTRIAMYLTTIDVLSLRRASMSFWFIFHTQQFWASRFMNGAERSWLFEAQEFEKSRDWRSLYRLTNNARTESSDSINNRKRVWALSQRIIDVLSLTLVPLSTTRLETDICEAGSECVEAGGRIQEMQPDKPQVHFYEACRIFHKQRVQLESLGRLSRVGLSFLRLGDASFLAGLRLLPVSGDSVQLGYLAPFEDFVDIQILRGFNLAIGSRGIHAIQFHTDRGTLPWHGDLHASPRTLRLGGKAPIKFLEFSFDACKITRISVGFPSRISPPLPLPAEGIQQEERLRQFGIWYPDVPASHLCLNVGAFPRHEYSTTGYQPLIWTLFGGPRGSYLKYLVAITAHMKFGTCFLVDFKYENHEISDQVQPVGRHKCTKAFPGCRDPLKFTIDGPGGEVVDSIELYLRYSDHEYLKVYRQGVLDSFKVFTNRGRNFHFRDPYPDDDDLGKWKMVTHKVNVTPGAAITGFYAQQDNQIQPGGLLALGVISEAI
ncbi:hypothetical protein F4778DRAFT_722782 [Xylariomycetidae sp. FL2044]|nr:hypothetical protein F4778DRAFT_722782 [Xylariomycetidae sp. FL2044]